MRGDAPVHIQRWAPADWEADEFVALMLTRRDYAAYAFYHAFLCRSFLAGGDLPYDEELLASALRFPRTQVRRCLEMLCREPNDPEVPTKKLIRAGGRVWNERVRVEIEAELKYRHEQSIAGKLGNSRRWASGTRSTPDRPPLPLPAPLPTPLPSPEKLGGAPGGGPVPTTGECAPVRAAVSRSKPNRTLPDDFLLSLEREAFARTQAVADPGEEFARFRDFHTAKGSTMRDWDAAWRTWCRNAKAFSRSAPRGGSPGEKRPQPYAPVAAASPMAPKAQENTLLERLKRQKGKP